MPTYTTRVVVPADRKIIIQLPLDFPVGEADVTVTSSRGSGSDDSVSVKASS